MISAQNARARADQVNTRVFTKQREDVIAAIKNGYDRGHYYAMYHDTLLSDLRKELEDNGYIVTEESTGINETSTKIAFKY